MMRDWTGASEEISEVGQNGKTEETVWQPIIIIIIIIIIISSSSSSIPYFPWYCITC